MRVAVALVCEDGEVGNSESKSYAAGLGEVVRIFLGRFYVVGVAIGDLRSQWQIPSCR